MHNSTIDWQKNISTIFHAQQAKKEVLKYQHLYILLFYLD